MDINEIKKLIKVIENSTITKLSVEEGNLKIKISKNGAPNSGNMQPVVSYQQPSIQPSNSESNSSQSIVEAAAQEEKNIHIINSPIVGTFYRSPAPDADPYVQVGDQVNAGTVLCIVEAMKLMNEIECDMSGKIVQILLEDGTAVEYNQPLFKIEKS
ncbi:MAG: acetyl-CoA carboxylase biotin carboxyl carrier protein [Ignavibacteriales bacterium]|nr:acetyl-CoA carboxylase biotin carboxyl carrier protein [Ignavibacteriales bacterium]